MTTLALQLALVLVEFSVAPICPTAAPEFMEDNARNGRGQRLILTFVWFDGGAAWVIRFCARKSPCHRSSGSVQINKHNERKATKSQGKSFGLGCC